MTVDHMLSYPLQTTGNNISSYVCSSFNWHNATGVVDTAWRQTFKGQRLRVVNIENCSVSRSLKLHYVRLGGEVLIRILVVILVINCEAEHNGDVRRMGQILQLKTGKLIDDPMLRRELGEKIYGGVAGVP